MKARSHNCFYSGRGDESKLTRTTEATVISLSLSHHKLHGDGHGAAQQGGGQHRVLVPQQDVFPGDVPQRAFLHARQLGVRVRRGGVVIVIVVVITVALVVTIVLILVVVVKGC